MARYGDLPYRTCVGMMLLNKDGLVFIGRRAGGIEHIDESHIWRVHSSTGRTTLDLKPSRREFKRT